MHLDGQTRATEADILEILNPNTKREKLTQRSQDIQEHIKEANRLISQYEQTQLDKCNTTVGSWQSANRPLSQKY